MKWANRVIEEYNKLADAGESVGEHDGKVIDQYEYDLARRTLHWADACAAKNAFKARTLAHAQAEEGKKQKPAQ
jgi:citrate lyase beta subunit